MPEARETILEIDLKALEHNYNYLRSKIGKKTKFLGVVKAFAYGSDSVRIAQKLEKIGVDYLAVAYLREGAILRDAGIRLPIMVLHPQPINFKTIIDRCLEPCIYNARTLKSFIRVSEELGQKDYPIHLNINTGLNRLGFWENDSDLIASSLNNTSSAKALSLFSHLAASEDLDEAQFTRQQIDLFNKWSKILIEKLNTTPFLHICNTSGVLNFPDAHMDMVRCGIGLYGFGNSAKEDQNLIPVARLKSVVSQIHQIEKGESVGYNRAFKSPGFKRTATIPVGHADGISRSYGNGKGFVFINNKKAPIIGNVCMDMIMVDVTDIPCNEGDEVIVFDEKNNANTLAEASGTISYELLTAVSQRVKRSISE